MLSSNSISPHKKEEKNSASNTLKADLTTMIKTLMTMIYPHCKIGSADPRSQEDCFSTKAPTLKEKEGSHSSIVFTKRPLKRKNPICQR